ncbi:hypothetical protein GNI_183580 [Gregarina niphandrodes]|uniref:Uncharacterized protein n=1 Tax=Gregarina niphandrodes TaxID=110365 RepID=A0A023AWU2_GRENI|nr:hypothetical protein GNI_183580 [Gregarina niphandrodes]EZG43189.1 hypothetical protein GNI_183580 [Gregarina niphandrodes]|eukprot:XP_011133557.1 hypothetical protein GNI_183580 [Gregarina niphandrodes]
MRAAVPWYETDCWAPGVLAIGAAVRQKSVEDGSVTRESLPMNSLPVSSLLSRKLVEDGKRGSEMTIYRNNVCSFFTSIAVVAETFPNLRDARARIRQLLSGYEWGRLRCITEKDLSECQLIYVELGTIISLFVTSPFGDVSEKAQETVSRLLQGVGGRRLRNHWIAGCLLQRAGVSTKKLIDFIVDTLGYIPAARTTAFEFLTKDSVPYSKYVQRAATTNRKELLLGREKILPTNRITASDFATKIFAKTYISGHELRDIVSRTRNTRPKPAVAPIYRPGTRPRNDEPCQVANLSPEAIGKKLDQLMRGRQGKLAGIEEKDFDRCSLDYVELGGIVHQYLRDAFGSVCSRVNIRIATAMEEAQKSRRVKGWISGCLLQHAEVPIPDLFDLCIQELKYTPSTTWRLECLKPRNERYRTDARQKPVDPKMRFYELLGGLNEKVSLPEFLKLAAMNGKQQKEFLRGRYYSCIASLKRTETLGCTVARKSSPKPPAQVPSAPTSKQEKPAGKLPPQTVEPGGLTTVLDPSMMYCHPDDLIEFLSWVESSRH